jgi:hypothetical protein
MTTNNTAITSAATSAATALWDVSTASFILADSIATLCQATGENYKLAGQSLALAWEEFGGGVDGSQATRHLVEACHQTSMERKSASKFLNGVGLVSKQRIGQLLSVVFDGDKTANRNNGKADKENKESQDGLDKSGSGSGFTFEQILAAIKSLPSITKEQAQIAAATLASKIA